jgi:O-antigen ligase/tetratricopeptide (TPR) repeat protein
MKSNSKFIFVLLVLCVISPLVYSKTAMYGMSVPKVIFFWFLVEILVVTYLLLIHNSTENYPKKSWLAINVLVYTFFLIISSLFSESPTGSFLSSFERMNGVINSLHFIAFFFVVGNIQLSNKQWQIIGIVSCLVAAIISIFGISERTHFDDGRIQSMLSNPLYVAIYLIFHVFLLFIFSKNIIKSIATRPKVQTILYLLICTILLSLYLYTIVYTKSRAAVIALGFGLIIAILLIAFFKKSLRKYAFTVIFILMGALSVLYLNRHSNWVYANPALSRITNLSIFDNSISARKELWKMTFKGIPERPIIGWGAESYIYFFAKYYSPALHDKGFWYDKSHNFVLDKFVEGGILGLLSYLLMIGSIFYILWQKQTDIEIIEKCLISGYLMAYLIFNLTVFDCYVSLLILFFLMAYIQQKTAGDRIVFKKIKLSWVIIAILMMGFVCYHVVIRTFKIHKEWTAASQSTEMVQLIDKYSQAYKEAWIGKYDVGLDFVLQKDRVKSGSFDEATKLDYYNLAEKELVELLEKYPNHPILLSQLGFIQLYAGKQQEAINTYLLLQRIAPKRQVNLMDLAIFYLEAKEYKKAIELFDKVYQLDKTYQMALLYKAYGLSLSGDKITSKAIIYDLPTELIVDKMDFVLNVFKYNDDIESLLTLLSKTPDKSSFKQNTYLTWIQIAVNRNNNGEIHGSIYSYGRHFLCKAGSQERYRNKADSLEIYRIMDGVRLRKVAPEAITVFFDRFPDR